MAAKIFRINYKSDFILTMNSEAGWVIPFCIKFWTSIPSRAYYVGYDGETYTHCAYDPSEPTKLVVQFDDHHLPIGDLKFQIAYHFTVADFPNNIEDEVFNETALTMEIDGETYQVMLDFNGETAPGIDFSLPSVGVTSVNGKIGVVTLSAEDVGAQPTIEDLATIRSGAAAGATAVQPDEMTAALATKQNVIEDLATIRSGAAAGATAVQPAALQEGLAGKQDTISDLSTIRSGAAAGATAVQPAALTPIESALQTIEAVIPSAASSQNQLADKNFVNSSIATNTANFVGTYNSLAELQAVQNPTNNDYGFVIETDAQGNEYYDRYKYVAASQQWLFEYKIESTPFTADQWAAIQSGITSALVTKLNALPTAQQLSNQLAAKQDTISDLATIRSGAAAGATAYQKPGTGIPSTDLASAVQTSLERADEAAVRPYNTQSPDGMGYLVLDKDATFASQVTTANTIYEIRYDFYLSSNFTMPAGCVLRFNGGSINGNHTLTGNKTAVEAGDSRVFGNIVLDGSWSSTSACPEWFGAVGDGVTDDSAAFQKAVDSFPVVFLGGKKYLLGTTISLNSFNNVKGNKTAWIIADVADGAAAFKMGYFSRCEGFTLELPNANTIGFLVNTKYVQETALAQKFNPIGTGDQQTISRTLYSTMIENVYIFKEEVYQGTTSGTAIKIVAEGDQGYTPGLVNAQFKDITINGQFDNGIDIATGSGRAWTNSISFEDILISRVAVGINLEAADIDVFFRYGLVFKRVDYQTPSNNANLSDCYYAVLNFGSRIIFEDSIVWDWKNDAGHSPVLINPNKTNDLHFIRTGFDTNYNKDYPFHSFTENKISGRLFSLTESGGVFYNYRSLSDYLPTTTSPSDALTILSTMPDGVYTMIKTQLPSFATILNVPLETQLYELYMMVIQSSGQQFLVSIKHSNSNGEDSGIDNYYAVFQKVETGAIEANRWKAQTYLPVPKGKTTSRPTGNKVPFGFKYFDTDLYKNIYAVGLTNYLGNIMWVGEDNLPLDMPRFGTNANKPTFGPTGFRYWDTDNSKMIQIASGTKASITLTFVSVNAATDTFALRLYTYENSSQAILYSIYLSVVAGESVTTLRDAVKKELEKIGIICTSSGSDSLDITAPYYGKFYTTLTYNGTTATSTNVTEAKTQGTITWQ